jgi:hypothetical protein
MKLIIAYIAIAVLVVSSASADNTYIKVTCKKATHALAFYPSKDCTGTPAVGAIFSGNGVCQPDYALIDGKSSKYSISADGKTVNQTSYSSTDCTGAAASGIFNPSSGQYTVDKCEEWLQQSRQVVKLTAGVYDYTVGDAECKGTSIENMLGGDCYSTTRVTCSSDNTKYHYELFGAEGCSGTADLVDAKEQESGKCYDLAVLSGAGKFSVYSSFAIIALAMLFL